MHPLLSLHILLTILFVHFRVAPPPVSPTGISASFKSDAWVSFSQTETQSRPGLELIQPARPWNYGGPWHSAYVKQLRSLSKCASDPANLGQAEAVSGARQTGRQREFDKTEIWLSCQHASYIKKPADLLAECKGVLLMHCAGRIILIYLGHNAEHCFAHIQNLGTISQVVHSRSGEKTQ